jgi:phosphatidate cytidylyltransferase
LLKQRIITALILIPLAIGWMFFLSLDAFSLGAILIFLLASREWGRFVFPSHPHLLLLPMGALLTLTLWLNPPAQLLLSAPHPVVLGILYAGALWWLCALVMVLRYPHGTRLWRSSPFLKALFGVLTLLPFFWALLLLRSHSYLADPLLGGWTLFFVMLLVWCADSGAYFVGRAFGSRKMLPAVSPKKTLEGLLGGLLLAAIVAGAVAYSHSLSVRDSVIVVICALLAVLASVLGDLSESLFKRVAGIKDSGRLLPGHGGILDRIDSLTAALPIFVVSYLLLN